MGKWIEDITALIHAERFCSIKVRHPEAFFSVELYRKVCDVLGGHNFRLPVRRFILDLFDRSVLRNIVLDEEESENESIRTERPPQARPQFH